MSNVIKIFYIETRSEWNKKWATRETSALCANIIYGARECLFTSYNKRTMMNHTWSENEWKINAFQFILIVLVKI